MPPRICLKGNFRLDESDKIVSIFRDHPIDYESDVDIRKNTGFHSIQMTGKYFIENNIPAAALRGDYVNPRLNTEKIQADYKKPTVKNVRALTERWGSYWRDEHPSGDPSLYKSTLIHPLTLWDNEISNEFKSSVDIENVDRSIFGFLCFDHRTVDYFEESSDSFVAKIFADILCTYIFIRMVYTDLSHTFSAVLDLLGKKNLKLNIHKIGQIRQPRAPDTIGSFLGQPAGIPDTPNLVVTDKVLLDFIKRTTDTGRVSKRQARPS